jgi:acetyltransferase
MNPDDLRLRFFTPMTALPHQLLARLCQLDYDRAMALIARPAEGAMALGVVRFSADPDNRQAEFAVAVRSDWKGRGLGYLLVSRIIEVAQGRGITEIFGEVLRENEPMLRLCHALGFTVSTHPQEPHLLRLAKRLG